MPPTGQAKMSEWLVGGGELGSMVRAKDWSTTPLGSRDRWPQSLRTVVNLVLASRSPMCLLWGSELRLLYNDGCIEIAGDRHPSALGAPMSEVWAEIWPELEPALTAVMDRGESFVFEDRPFRFRRRDVVEDAHFTFSFSPVHVESGAVGGVLTLLQETTAIVKSRRLAVESEERLRSLIDWAPYGAHLYKLDPEDRLVFVGFNKSAEKILGISHGQLVGKTIDEAFPTLMPEIGLRYAEVAATGRAWETEQVAYEHGRVQGVFEVRAVQTAPRRMAAFFRDITERSRLERELRESEEKYRALVETTATGFVVLDDEGRVLDANQEYVRLTGRHQLAEILGHGVLEWSAPHDQARNAAELRRCLQGGLVRGLEIEYITPDGALVPIEINATMVQTASGRRILALDRDITARRRSQEEMERLAAAVRHASELINLASLDGRMIFLNEAGCRILGIQPEEVSRTNLIDIIPGSLKGLVENQLLPTLLASGSWKGDLQYVNRKTGQLIDVYATTSIIKTPRSGKPLYFANVSTDVTERKRSEEKFRTLYAISPVAIVLNYLDTGQFVESNKALWDMTGYSEKELSKLTFWDITPSKYAEQEGRRLELLRSVGRYGPYEKEYIRKDGSLVAVLLSGVRIAGPNGRDLIFSTIQDISELKRKSEALREADQRKTEFLAMLSHELRNPLAPIRNSLYVLDHAAPGGEQARRAHNIIDRQIGQLTRLVDDLLDLTRITRGIIELKRERIDMNELARSSVEDHRLLFEKAGVSLELLPAAGEVWLNGDRARLAQVIGNLVQNSVKFTAPGGKTTVSLATDRARAEAVLKVRDTGSGISPEIMSRLFEVFTQADKSLDRRKGGLGLGLALVKSLVEKHGGSVSAASEGLGHGSEFTVRLPLEIAGSEPTAYRHGIEASESPLRILVVEDNLDAADSLSEALALSGHAVEVAYDGPSALQKARTYRPEVVLCDIGLPKMDGYTVARKIRADPELGRLPLVALTGYAGPEDAARAKEAGFDAHIAKPPDLEALQRALSEAMQRR